MMKNFHHNQAPGQAGGRATEGWPRRGETSGSERVKEHGGHGDMKREAGVELFLKKQPLNSDPSQKLFFLSVFSVSSVVKPLLSPLA